MIFLIEYNRRRGELVTFKRFADDDRRLAANERLQLELELNRRGVEHEVVILEASSEAAVRRTHRRYFETLAELVEPI
ncbi:MAG: hypothetical protein HOP17_09510 [Acidobacteria bacterium]|nr:hypothetical protein [Acidobacteriota bacterium]